MVFIGLRFLGLKPKVAAFARLGIEAHFGAHAFGGFAHDGQADASALVFRNGMSRDELSTNSEANI